MAVKRPSTVAEALHAQLNAKAKRQEAESVRGIEPASARFLLLEAQQLDAHAKAVLKVPEGTELGTGREFIPTDIATKVEKPGLVDTTKHPDSVTLEASRQRLELIGDARCLTLGADMAATIEAGNSLEKALAHGIAGCHSLAMRFAARAQAELDLAERQDKPSIRQASYIEANRCATTASRLFEAMQKGATTLQRLRSGGQQIVTVVHQHVDARGSNVAVAGAVNQTGGLQGVGDGK